MTYDWAAPVNVTPGVSLVHLVNGYRNSCYGLISVFSKLAPLFAQRQRQTAAGPFGSIPRPWATAPVGGLFL